MFDKQTFITTRLTSFAIAFTLTAAMLLSINILAVGDAHAQQLAAAVSAAPDCVHI